MSELSDRVKGDIHFLCDEDPKNHPEILYRLKLLKKELAAGTVCPQRGICFHAKVSLDILVQEWPEFSGRVAYPVKGPGTKDDGNVHDHSYESFRDAAETNGMWTGEYGSSRIRLLNYLINHITERLTPDELNVANQTVECYILAYRN